MKFPFIEKRDIVGDIKRKPKRLRNKSMKSKYVLIIEDDFGYRKAEYYICTEKKIQQLLFKKYILLKRKAIKDEDSLGGDLKLKARMIESKKVYEVRLDVGFKLFHRIYYERLDDNVTHLVVQHDMHTSHYHGYFDRATAFKMAVDTALKDSRYSKDIDDEDEVKIRKVFFNKSLQVKFNYWYRCSYEYDEWDESSVVIVAKQIKFKKR